MPFFSRSVRPDPQIRVRHLSVLFIRDPRRARYRRHDEKFRLVARNVIGSLNSDDRDLLEEHYVDDATYTILARRRGITAGGIGARICRLRRDLFQQFVSEMR